jgi:flagellar motor protein MotB
MGEQKVIIKKVKKVVHGGGHGGSNWKVAYADFVTALMAFFLLLWLISMVSPEKRARVAQYFNTFSLFDKSGASILQNRNQAVVARTLARAKHPIAIEGHTDARVYSSMHYSNWELSTERASAARIVLEEDGLPPGLLLSVVGYAATQPLIRNDPMDPRNRRISIMVYNDVPKQS